MKKFVLALVVAVTVSASADAGPLRRLFNRRSCGPVATVAHAVTAPFAAVGGCAGGVCYPQK